VWQIVLDLDALSRTECTPWVWRGSRALPRSRDAFSQNGKSVTRALISLSKDIEDEGVGVIVREFDLLSCQFVRGDEAFSISRTANSRMTYQTRDLVYVATDFGDGTLTHAGYPRTIREWTRGSDINEAPVLFEGEHSDIAVEGYISDQRCRGGHVYEVLTRIIGPRSSRHWVRKVKYEQRVSEGDLSLSTISRLGELKEMQVPESSEIEFVGNVLVVKLRSDWSPDNETNFKRGSILYVNTHKFLKYGPADRVYHVLFEPKEFVKCDDYIVTKEFLILSITETLKSKLEFYKLEKDSNKLRLVYFDKMCQTRSVNIRAVDPCFGDKFWYSTSGFIEPSALWLADASKVDRVDKKHIQKNDIEVYLDTKLKSLSTLFDASNLIVRQVMATSKDGTKVPYFIISNEEISKERRNPTLLCAYGPFNTWLSPTYAASPGIAWMERGGVYVEAIIRGGGEFGDEWRESGSKEKLGNAIGDYIAVAEDLIASKICSSKTLAIRGGAGGALVVANAYVRRPELFAAVSCSCPIVDLKRMKSMGCPRHWITALGDPDSGDWENFLERFSPFHNIDAAVKKYPPILFTTIEKELSAHPGHSRKMVKKLWNEGLGKKWPAFYFESQSTSPCPDSKQYALVTTLSYDFLYKKVAKSAIC
jgi:prolyl oligopeptidase